MNKYYVYAIKSKAYNRIYVGLTHDINKRLNYHNKGFVKSTKFWIPWEIIYSKFAGDRKDARKLEKKLKSGYGKEFLKSIGR